MPTGCIKETEVCQVYYEIDWAKNIRNNSVKDLVYFVDFGSWLTGCFMGIEVMR